MDQETLYQELKHLLTLLKRILKKDNLLEASHDTRFFMNHTIDLYIALKANTFIERDPKFQDYIQRSARKLSGITFNINYFILQIDHTLSSTFYDDEWIGVCWQRSAVEAIKEMYQNTIFEVYFEDLDTEDVDEGMESRGQREGYLSTEEIPLGIPTSHWWWWYPEKPPETRD